MADIIEIAEVRLERKRNGFCQHNHLGYDEVNQHIECLDCKLPVQPFQAFMILARNYSRALDNLKSQREDLERLEQRSEKTLLKAVREIDSVWRSRTMLPCCPHCGRGITPDDGLGQHRVGLKYEMERRRFQKAE